MKPSTRSLFESSLMRMTPRPGPGKEVDLVGLAEDGARFARRGDEDLASRYTGSSDDFRAFRRARIAPSGTCAWLDERLEAEPHRVAVARDRDRVHRRHVAFFLCSDDAGDPRVEAERGDDSLAVFQLEEALYRLAVARRRWNVDEPRSIGDAEVTQEDRPTHACFRGAPPARCRPRALASWRRP